MEQQKLLKVLIAIHKDRPFCGRALTMMRDWLALAAVAIACVVSAPASAATATFIEPSSIGASDLDALSAAGDGGGFLIALGETLAILLDPAIAADTENSISIFSAAPANGTAFATIRIGSYNNGSPEFVASRNFKAGNSVNIGNLLQNGCQLLGGCDYIEIVTTRTTKGAAGVEIDYVTVDGEVVAVTSPTPEPATWALMIVAFAGLAARLKARRRRCVRRKPPAEVRPDRRSRPWPATTAPQTVHP